MSLSSQKIMSKKRGWYKVSDLALGMEIAVPKSSLMEGEDDIFWDKIVSIKHVGREQVYDIEVKDTHNFIGNDIFAHNTYVNMGEALSASMNAISELDLNLNSIAGTITPLAGSPSESFATAFFNNIKTTIGAWLADTGNGIARIFAVEITVRNLDVDNLCLNDATGKTCITKTQLDNLLANSGSSISSDTGVIPNPPPAPDAPITDLTYSPDGLSAPIITLDGETLISMDVGSTYVERGALAKDSTGASLETVVTGAVDTSTPGTYVIHYNAIDAIGNKATEVTRTVTVNALPDTPPTS
ncbi:MAG: immunoglobulin-like domain-containing protein [bacterium]